MRARKSRALDKCQGPFFLPGIAMGYFDPKRAPVQFASFESPCRRARLLLLPEAIDRSVKPEGAAVAGKKRPVIEPVS